MAATEMKAVDRAVLPCGIIFYNCVQDGYICPESVTTQMKAVCGTASLRLKVLNSVSLGSCEMLDLFDILLRMKHF